MHLICVSAAIRTGPKIERAVSQRMCEGIADCGCRASLFWMSQALQPGESQDCLNVAWSEGPKGDAQDQAGNWKCYHRMQIDANLQCLRFKQSRPKEDKLRISHRLERSAQKASDCLRPFELCNVSENFRCFNMRLDVFGLGKGGS